MSWFKMDDGFATSKPVLRIPRRYRLQAVGLWSLAGSWSAKEETDGFIPEFVLEELCGTPSIAALLVKCGLWEVVSAEPDQNVNGTYSERTENVNGTYPESGLAGWKFRNWDKYNPTKAQLEEKRESERVRKAEYRKSQQRPKGVPAGHPTGHAQDSTPPDPTRPDPTHLKDADASFQGGNVRELRTRTPQPLPAGFAMTEPMQAWALRTIGTHRKIDLQLVTADFIVKNSGKLSDSWPDAWRRWIIKAAEFYDRDVAANGGPGLTKEQLRAQFAAQNGPLKIKGKIVEEPA